MVTLSSVRVVLAASFLSALVVDGFVVIPGTNGIHGVTTTTTTATQLHGRRVMKRGSLGDIGDDDTDSSNVKTGPRRSTRQQRKVGSSRKKKAANSSTKKKSSAAASSSSMSPDLAKFLEASGDGSSVEVVPEATNPKKKGGRQRRQKQSALKELDEARGTKIAVVLEELQEVLEGRTGKVDDILTVVEKLLEIPSSNNNNDPRRVLSAQDRTDFRLAWVGSDDAICHIGTGLHKVPLARMQEVFMNCLGKNEIEILEVISLIGPFPNVKNILQGTTKISTGTKGSEVQIVMERMVDGTGKEIKADEVRRVDLEVAFCDERAIVVLMPDEDNENAKPLDDNGKRLLLFVREDELDEKLEGLRVNEID